MPLSLQHTGHVQRRGGILLEQSTQTLRECFNAYIAKELVDILVPHFHATVGHDLIKQALSVAHAALCRFGDAHETGARDAYALALRNVLKLCNQASQ